MILPPYFLVLSAQPTHHHSPYPRIALITFSWVPRCHIPCLDQIPEGSMDINGGLLEGHGLCGKAGSYVELGHISKDFHA